MLVIEQSSSALKLSLDLESLSISDWVSWEVSSSGVNGPSLVGSVVAGPPGDVSVLSITLSMNIKAKSWDVSDVSGVSTVEGRHLSVISSLVVSDNGSDSNLETLASLVGDGPVSLEVWSDGSGSPVEDPPLLLVPWLGVLDSESVLVSTNVLVPEEGSSRLHSSSDLESLSILQWLRWPLLGSLVDPPGLVETVVAVPEDNVSVVGVAVSVNIQALLTVVSDVSSGSTVPSDLLVGGSSVWSNADGNSNSELSVELVGNGVSSLLPGSNGVSSGVKDEPLVGVVWVVPVHSQSELGVSEVLLVEERLVGGHS